MVGDLQAEKARLQTLLKARKTRPGFGDNVREIQRRIDEIDDAVAKET